MPKSAVILLSGGLDSYVSLAAALKGYLSVDKNSSAAQNKTQENGAQNEAQETRESFDIKLALTFDYGQRAVGDEIEASKKIAKAYNIEHRVIKLPFLAEISNSALNNKNAELEFETLGKESAKAVWVPNRNGLFLNIAACFCDTFGYEAVIIGANKEEAGTFPDNSSEFCNILTKGFKYSTNAHPVVVAPLINLEKFEIINLALKLGVDLKLLKSCYNNTNGAKKHCGTCESCKRLKSAILKSGNKDLLKLFF